MNSSSRRKTRFLSIFLGFVIGLMGLSEEGLAKSLFVIADKDAQPSIPIYAYDIQGTNLVFQTSCVMPYRFDGAVGVSVDTVSEYLLVTFEFSDVLEIINARTMTRVGQITAPGGAANLAGIVVDHAKQKVYTVDRLSNHLYVYSWDPVTITLTLDGDSYVSLAGCLLTFGIALDEANGLLYVGDGTPIIKYYHTSDWLPAGQLSVSHNAIGIAFDPVNKYIYSGSGYPESSSYLLSQYDVVNNTEITVDVGSSVLGVAVDPDTGLVYLTTHSDGSNPDRLLVYDSNLTLQWSSDDIGSPTGVCIPSGEIAFNPLNLSNDDGVAAGEIVLPGSEIVYTLSYDNENNTYDVHGVTITDAVPEGTSYVEASATGGGIYDSDSNEITWEIGTVTAGTPPSSVTFRVKVSEDLTPGTTLINACTIESDETPQTTINEYTEVNLLSSGIYYVDIFTGDDSTGRGSSAHPWKTLHYAIEQVNIGSSGTYLLNLAPGTYSVAAGEPDEVLTITQGNVSIIGETGSRPVLDGTSANNWTTGIQIATSNVTIRELAVTGFSDSNESGITCSSGTGDRIKNCELYGNYHGILVDGCSPEISQTRLYDNTTGISAIGSSADTSPSIINNLIYGSAMTDGIKVLADTSGFIASPTIYHNTIDGGMGDGITIEASSGGEATPEIKYNIITAFSGYGITNSGGTLTIDYNDVWNNTGGNYSNCSAGTHDISSNPLFASYELQSTSPCIDQIPLEAEDPVEIDYAGYARPRPWDVGTDMGAYEYVADITWDYTLQGGTGHVTDYRIFTVPVVLETGGALQEVMEDALGAYDKAIWRVFAWDPSSSSYREMDDPSFATLSVFPGRAFWVISIGTDTISLSGQPYPDGDYLTVPISPGWNMIAVPWPAMSIELDNIAVSGGIFTYWVTSTNNTFTQQYVWDYTGTGTYNGYQQLTSGASLTPGRGYWIYVNGDSSLSLLIPKDNTGGYFEATSYRSSQGVSPTSEDTEAPPPPPGVMVEFSSSSGGTTVSGSGGCFVGTVGEVKSMGE